MRKPTSFVLICCALLFTTFVFAQEFSISGFVNDDQGQAVTYATILLIKAQDSTMVNGVTSNEKGFFLVKDLAADNYLLKVSFLGYKDVYQSIALEATLDVGTIVLEENSEMLNEVNITVKKPTLTKEPDRLVFNIENTALTEGNMFQVLKSTPGILVLDNSILVKNTAPTVYINDKKVHLSNAELVQLLEGSSANSIKSVEVITNPSSKYDAESGAVINIVMSKNLVTGYRGNVFASFTQGVFPRYQAGMSHFFKSEKINFFANYTYSDDKINREQDDDIEYFDQNDAIDQIFKSNINRNTWSKTHTFNFNFDYSWDEQNTLSLSSNMLVLPYFDYRIKNNTDVFDANQALVYYLQTNNNSEDNKYNLGFDLDYVHKFKTAGEKISAHGHFTTYDYSREQNVFSSYFDNNDDFLQTTAFRTDSNQNTSIYTGQLDYIWPLNETSSFEAGLKGSNIQNESDITQFDVNGGTETIDENNTDAFDYDETILAGYANFSKDWEKLSLVAGLRVEQTNATGVSIFDEVTNKQDYFEWFPTVSLSYTFTENFSLYSNYKRSIQRPNYQSLNPFRFFLNDFTIVEGNPMLQPVLTDHAVVGTTLFERFTVESYYKISNNSIFELPRQNNQNNTITYSALNLNRTVEYGFDFVTYFDIVSNWSVYVVTSFYNIDDEGNFEGATVNNNLWSNYSILSNDWSLLKDRSLNANLTLTYVGKNQAGLQEISSRLVSDLSISKNILDKQGVISLSVADLFNTQDYSARTRYLRQSSQSFYDIDNRYVKLGFRYKFGNTNLSTNQRTKAQQETDRLEKSDN